MVVLLISIYVQLTFLPLHPVQNDRITIRGATAITLAEQTTEILLWRYTEFN